MMFLHTASKTICIKMSNASLNEKNKGYKIVQSTRQETACTTEKQAHTSFN